MNKELAHMLYVQGEMRVKLMKYGMDAALSMGVAADIIDLIVNSNMIKDEYKEQYESLKRDEKYGV